MKKETAENFEEYVNDLRKEYYNEADEKKKATLHNQYMKAMEQLQVIEHDDRELLDKRERRRIEEEKNNSANELELKKQRWAKVETAVKLFGMVFTPILTCAVYWKLEEHIGTLEEDGRWTTDAARKHHQNGPRLPWN